MSSPSGLVRPELVQKRDRVLGGQVDGFGAKRSLDSRPRLASALWRDCVLIGLGLLLLAGAFAYQSLRPRRQTATDDTPNEAAP